VIIPEEWVRKNKYMLEKILTTFNSFFQGKAEAKIVIDRLEITIVPQTLIISISLLEVRGGQSTGSS
jgi:hypothetical protein